MKKGKFPDILKMVKITPIFKKGNSNDPKYLRIALDNYLNYTAYINDFLHVDNINFIIYIYIVTVRTSRLLNLEINHTKELKSKPIV